MSGARYEISIDGVVRTHRDIRDVAVEAATFSKSKNPQSRVVVLDLITGTRSRVRTSESLKFSSTSAVQ